jgi:hypothetical protein
VTETANSLNHDANIKEFLSIESWPIVPIEEILFPLLTFTLIWIRISLRNVVEIIFTPDNGYSEENNLTHLRKVAVSDLYKYMNNIW